MLKTREQFDSVINICKELFEKKLTDYGASWRILRPSSVTDQIFIKAKRIRSIEEKQDQKIDENIESELIAIVNYGVIGLIQLELEPTDTVDISAEQALNLYNKYIYQTVDLMCAKNHDYDEAWRSMRIQSITDLILMKLYRTKQIEDNCGKTVISEGVEANYMDMINYSIFGLILLGLAN